MQNQTINLDKLKPGRIASWVYEVDSATYTDKSNKGGRAGIAPNPYYGEVSVRKVMSGQIATHEMYVRAWEKAHSGTKYQPAPERAPRFEPTGNPCVVRSLSNQELQVRIMNTHTGKVTYFVNGIEANEEQLAVIAMYERKRERNPHDVNIMFPYVDNLSNVIDPE
jgi:hypothetical protein